jgi:protoporphyrinogen oxidase
MHYQENNTTLIAGAGLTGLMSALKLSKLKPNQKIIVFDKASGLGGKYSSFTYSDDFIFDNGMHVIYESCNPEVDDLYREIIPDEGWNIYKKNEKDIAGLYFRGRLQNYSHYMDLRSLAPNEFQFFTGSFFDNLNNSIKLDPRTFRNCAEFLRGQFGKEIYSNFHFPILKRMYGLCPEELHTFASKITALERIILFDPKLMLELMESSSIRSRLAFPDQLNLPDIRLNDQKALYPKKFGMIYFVEKLKKTLLDRGVQLMTESKISEIKIEKFKISEVTIASNEGNATSIPVENVLWTLGWPSIANELKIKFSDLEFQRGPEIIYVNLIFDAPINADRLYYFYCYDEGFATFRVTNYSNYCSDAISKKGFPVCVEIWPSKIGLEINQLNEEACVKLAVNELEKFGVININHKLIFSRMQASSERFPMPSLLNSNSVEKIKSRVLDLNLKNIYVTGVMSENDLFFLPDILNHSFSKLKEL